jgi:hypothetical protein
MNIYHFKRAAVSAVPIILDKPPLVGTNHEDGFGTSVDFNNDGTICVVGAPWFSANNNGEVKVYKYNSATKLWDQFGQSITGTVGEQIGYSVAITDDGYRIVIGSKVPDTSSGAIYVYDYNLDTSQWVKTSTIPGVYGYWSGFSVAINSTGTIIAYGSPKDDSVNTDRGSVSVLRQSFKNIDLWQLIGKFSGEASEDNGGWSIALNSSGDILAIGTPFNDAVGNASGHIRVYKYSGGTMWSQMGVDIDGTAAEQQSGFSVSLDNSGNMLIVGNILDSTVSTNSGVSKIYRFNGTQWTQYGDTIAGNAGDLAGYSVSINNVGDIVSVGFPFKDSGNKVDTGATQIYKIRKSKWLKFYPRIPGITAQERSGWSNALSKNANKIIVGSPDYTVFETTVSPSPILSFTQMGESFVGETIDDLSGWSVDINGAGDRVAIGAWANANINGTSGHTRIYQWNSSTSAWTQLGLDIDGEASTSRSGWSVSLNELGNRVAIGAIYNDGTTNNAGDNRGHTRIYEYVNGAWIQMGLDIDGEAVWDESGYSVSLNAAGDRVAIGARANDGTTNNAGDNRGHTRIYQWNSSTSAWTQMGLDINGEAEGDQSGWSVSLNAAGDRVAIGAIQNSVINGISTSEGHTRIYQWNSSTSSWIQLGLDINGESSRNNLGWSVSLNELGNRVAIGAVYNDGTTGVGDDNRGHTRIYEYVNGAWTQMGLDIDGEASKDESGYSVSLNAAGDRVAIGAPYNDGTTGVANDNRGHTRIYQWNSSNSSWIQLGLDIDGEANPGQTYGENSGYSVSLNKNGDRVVIGAPYSAKTRVYQLNSTFPTTTTALKKGIARIYTLPKQYTFWNFNNTSITTINAFKVTTILSTDSIVIKWGDGTQDSTTSGSAKTHTYTI